MNTQLRIFAALALGGLAIGIGLLVHEFLRDDTAQLADLAMSGGLLLLDLPLILLAAANIRVAQIIYAGLFFFGLSHRIGELGSLFKVDGGIGMIVLAAVVLQAAGMIVLIREVRSQRTAAKAGVAVDAVRP